MKTCEELAEQILLDYPDLNTTAATHELERAIQLAVATWLETAQADLKARLAKYYGEEV